MERRNVTHDDDGKKVVNSTGDKIGMVTEVNGDIAHVDPDPVLADTISSKLGWGEADEGDYELTENRIHTITEDEIRVKD